MIPNPEVHIRVQLSSSHHEESRHRRLWRLREICASTRKLGPLLDLPVFHLDALSWRPGWVETPKDEWRATNKKLVEQDGWIIDG